jgi:hypothetical protein
MGGERLVPALSAPVAGPALKAQFLGRALGVTRCNRFCICRHEEGIGAALKENGLRWACWVRWGEHVPTALLVLATHPAAFPPLNSRFDRLLSSARANRAVGGGREGALLEPTSKRIHTEKSSRPLRSSIPVGLRLYRLPIWGSILCSPKSAIHGDSLLLLRGRSPARHQALYA